MHDSNVERGIASRVKFKGGKESIPFVKSFECRLCTGCTKDIIKFTDEKAKEGFEFSARTILALLYGKSRNPP